MKKRIISLLLCLLLLGTAATSDAAVGGGDDPLISLSYISDTFLPQLWQSLKSLAGKTVTDYAAAQPAAKPGLKTVNLAAGGSLSLRAGQQLVLCSGSVKLTVDSGTLLNVTAGRKSTGGDARIGNRYLVCGNSGVSVSASAPAVVLVSAGVPATGSAALPGACPFTDVPENEWYYADVVSAYERGLVNGKTKDRYDPQGMLTAGEAVKLAACMHQLYHSGGVTLQNASDGRAWYMSYVDYALNQGIMETGLPDYEAAINRGEFIRLFFNTMPEKEYTRINLIMDGAIPDVATDAPLAKQVYTFYMAGILTGYPAGDGYLDHAFGPESTITRAEIATVMNRMLEPSARKSFTMD